MINKDFFLALEDLEREKGIKQEDFISWLETALVTAYKNTSACKICVLTHTMLVYLLADVLSTTFLY